jgi:transposase
MGDLLGADYSLVEKNALYRCLDKVLPHKRGLFGHLTQRWQDLFGVRFDILLYDLTSTYFESPLPEDEKDKRRYGYSRDKRPDCVQVVIALVVTPEGFPLAYEVLAGNTADKTTLKLFVQTIEAHYGRAERVWVMDRGIPTEEVLAEMRAADPPVYYLVGTPRGRLTKLERDLLPLPWATVRPGVNVKLLPQDGELYVLAESRDRLHKERAMRWRRLKGLVKRLKQLQQMKLNDTRQLLLKLGEAKGRYRAAWRLIEIVLPHTQASSASPESAAPDTQVHPLFSFRLNRKKLREVRRREGRYLLRTNLCGHNPAELWQFYLQLTEVEAAFKNLKDDLQLRPLYHQLEHRIEAHIFVAFMAYCLHISLRARLKLLAPGLTSRAVLDKLAGIQMLDVHFPTTDGRTLIWSRYTEPNPDQRLLLERLNLTTFSLKGELSWRKIAVSAYDGGSIPVRDGEEGDDCAHRSDPTQHRDRVGPVPRFVSPDRNVSAHQGILHRVGGAGETEHQSTGGVFGRWPSAKLDQQGADTVAVVRRRCQ